MVWCYCGLWKRVTSIEAATDITGSPGRRVVSHGDPKGMQSKRGRFAGKRARTINVLAGALKKVLQPPLYSEPGTTGVVHLAREGRPPYLRRRVSRTGIE